jgi:hypothetical protein
MRTQTIAGQRIRRVAAVAVASTFLAQNFAWAVCSDGTTFPTGNQGFVYSTLNTVAPHLANMSPNIFTATAGSVFIPDNSSFENNDPTNVSTVAKNGSGIAGLPVAAVGGHNWAFDQGSTTCKATSTTYGNFPPVPPVAGQAPAGWAIPANTTTDCFVLPIVSLQNGQIIFTGFGVVPLTSQAIIPACDPTALSTAPLTPNPRNTRLNQLGCSISQADTGTFTARDQTVAPAYVATASIKGGIFMQRLDNTPNTAVGDSGRVITQLIVFADTAGIPLTTPLTNAMVSPDGHYVAATSVRRDVHLYGCNMPLGDPGRIDSPPVSAQQFALSANTITGVKCMNQIGLTGLQVTLSNVWGVDNQPYLSGTTTAPGGTAVTTAGTTGGNPGSWSSPSAWPQCIALGKGETFTLPAVYPSQSATLGNYNAVATLDAAIADVFAKHKNGGCQFGPNAGFSSAGPSLATYQASNGNMYMFAAGGTGHSVAQARLTIDATGATNYNTRTYFSNGTLGFITGVGVAPDMNFTTGGSFTTTGAATPAAGATGSGSLIAMTDVSSLGLGEQEAMTRLPLCEDF